MADPHESPSVTAEDRDAAPEEVDALPVLARDAGVASDDRGEAAVSLRTAGPGVQVAAVAATGFVAGAAVVGLVHRRRRRHAQAPRRAARRAATRGGPVGELVQIVGTRSLLVDVHLLGGRD
jgi:hypothetical protein